MNVVWYERGVVDGMKSEAIEVLPGGGRLFHLRAPVAVARCLLPALGRGILGVGYDVGTYHRHSMANQSSRVWLPHPN